MKIAVLHSEIMTLDEELRVDGAQCLKAMTCSVNRIIIRSVFSEDTFLHLDRRVPKGDFKPIWLEDIYEKYRSVKKGD